MIYYRGARSNDDGKKNKYSLDSEKVNDSIIDDDDNVIVEEDILLESDSDNKEYHKDSIPSDPLDLVEYRYQHAVQKEINTCLESPAIDIFCTVYITFSCTE